MYKSREDKIFDTITYMVMIIVIIITLYPFLHVLAVALNDASDSLAGGITIFPRKLSLESFKNVLAYENLFYSFIISVLRTVTGTVLSLTVVTSAAFALTKKSLPGYKFIYIFFIISLFMPSLVIPNFLLYQKLGIYNTFLVYILPGTFSAFNMILLRTYILQLPPDMEESAYLDGASELAVFFKIVLPLAKPILATVGLFVAVTQWNEWSDTLYYITNPKLETLQFVLMRVLKQAEAASMAAGAKSFMQNQMNALTVTPNSIKMAITVIATVPIICVYPFLQRYFVKGMMIGAVKG